MSKKDKRLAAAAAARALLGMDDEGAVAQPGLERSPVTAEVVGSNPIRSAKKQKPKLIPPGQASFEKPTPAREPIVDSLTWSMRAREDESRAKLMQVGDAREEFTVAEKHWPKKWKHGELKAGDSVWYRGERFWIETVHPHWSKGVYARICDVRVHPDPAIRSGTALCYIGEKGEGHGKVISFAVHCDLLALAPQTKNAYAPQTTLAGEARKERAKAGIKDVGDPVAEMLRAAKDLEGVYKIASKYLDITVADLKKKYGHLNPGQQRMNCGNKMRAKWKKEQR